MMKIEDAATKDSMGIKMKTTKSIIKDHFLSLVNRPYVKGELISIAQDDMCWRKEICSSRFV